MKLSKLRYLQKNILKDLESKIVSIAGPRQVGKTTFSLTFLGNNANESHPAYLNWDNDLDRQRILNSELPSNEPLIIFDEIHKFKNWRNLLKGFYDKERSTRRFLVTGSARLDYYSKGGDSLDGRYFMYRMHPYSLRETNPTIEEALCLKNLLSFGGFPEPLSRANTVFHKRWQRTRFRRIILDDLRDLENVKEVSLIELLINFLPETVGSPLSIEKLKNRLQVAHQTVSRWLQILENLFVCFRVAPFGSPLIRAVKKEQKLYFWDWSIHASDPGVLFENMVAAQLLKYTHYQEDIYGDAVELRYLRDTDGREIDFVVIKNGKPEFAVECKVTDTVISKHISYFKERTEIDQFYQVHLGEKDYGDASTTGRVIPWRTFCNELNMP